MSLFGKKKNNSDGLSPISGMEPPGGMPSSTPSDVVIDMKQQGLTNDQIIQELQKQGYDSQQIFDAINMADPTNIPCGPINNMSSMNREGDINMEGDMSYPPDMGQNMHSFGNGLDGSKERIEEMAEAIIDEKWEELVKSINKIIEWKENMDKTIHKMEQEIKDMKDNFDRLHSSVVGKIDEYDKNITNVGTEVKAMEKVFEKVLPAFTENVGELRRLVKSAKK
jgi:hypothetical protein